MTWLLHHGPRDLAGSDLVVAVVLAEHCNPENGVAYPSVKRIAGMARISERQVTRILADLVTRNVLSVAWEATNKRPTGYLMVGFRGDMDVTPSKQPGVTSEAPRGDIQGQNPDLGVTPMSPKQLRTPSPSNTVVDPHHVTPGNSPPNPPGGDRRRRLPADWALTPELRGYAVAHGIPPNLVDAFAEEFKTYWGGDGRPKANWNQTFQNRVLERGPTYAPGGRNGRVTAAEMQAGGRGELVT